ncbi:hypothetical protein [Halopelagius fulvigenes]|uniref:Helix-turn-helix domain-containing protein n=1 Tax=Halopelagius fulvigenes TaxID=1198324 RepID=A0ABD5TXB6_9EURY
MTDSPTPKSDPHAYLTPPRVALLEAIDDAGGVADDDVLRDAADLPPRTLSHHLDVLETMAAITVKHDGAALGSRTYQDRAVGERRVQLTRRGESLVGEADPVAPVSEDHPAGDYVESGLSLEQRVGELESLVAELTAELGDDHE